MNTFLVVLLILAMIWVVISLVRGIVAFLQSTKLDLESATSGSGDASQATRCSPASKYQRSRSCDDRPADINTYFRRSPGSRPRASTLRSRLCRIR